MDPLKSDRLATVPSSLTVKKKCDVSPKAQFHPFTVAFHRNYWKLSSPVFFIISPSGLSGFW